MKYLIAGLGNIGQEYSFTRHNIGFLILDALASASNVVFSPARYGDLAEYRYKGRTFILLKPSTYMNLSGNAVRYWLQKAAVETTNLLVLVDDLALPFGQLRLRKGGSDGGHNGLGSIIEVLGNDQFARLRFGIGPAVGNPVNFVLGKWQSAEEQYLPERLKTSADLIRCFGTQGIDRTMTLYNRPWSPQAPDPAEEKAGS
ncbi:MAG: aminoacyl-tRNA hydrolase [Bacteroidales bacterium]